MHRQASQLKVLMIILIGLVAISSASVMIKACQAPSLVIASWRMGIAALFYWGVSVFQHRHVWTAFSVKERNVALLSGVFLAIHFITWITSLSYTSVASSVVLVQSAPIFVVIGSFLFLHEKPGARTILGVLLTLSGAIIIGIHDFSIGETSLLGNFLATGGAIGAAVYMLAGRNLRARINVVTYVTFVYSVAAIILLSITILARLPLWGYDLATYGLLIALALVPQVIGHTSFNWALKHFSATTVSIIILGEPIGASLLAFFILGETPGWITILGGIIIIIGVILVILFEGRQK